MAAKPNPWQHKCYMAFLASRASPRYDVICHLTAPTDWHGVFGFLTTEANAVSAPIPQGHAGLPSCEPVARRRSASGWLGRVVWAAIQASRSARNGCGANGRRDLER